MNFGSQCSQRTSSGSTAGIVSCTSWINAMEGSPVSRLEEAKHVGLLEQFTVQWIRIDWGYERFHWLIGSNDWKRLPRCQRAPLHTGYPLSQASNYYKCSFYITSPHVWLVLASLKQLPEMDAWKVYIQDRVKKILYFACFNEISLFILDTTNPMTLAYFGDLLMT